MAKFESNMTNKAPGSFQVFGGVTEKASSPFGGFEALLPGIQKSLAASAGRAADQQKLEDARTIGQNVLDQLDLEEEQAKRNQELADMREEQSLLAQSDNPEDRARLVQVQAQYGRLQAAEAAGSMPSTIKARQRALLRSQISENPHLANDILKIFKNVDSVQASDGDMSVDPRKAAINESIKLAAQGITVDVQVKAARAKQQQMLVEAELATKAASGKLQETDVRIALEGAMGGMALDLDTALMGLLDNTQAIDDEGNITGDFNKDTAKIAATQYINQAVSQQMTQILQAAKESNVVLRPEFLSGARKQMVDELTAQADSYLTAYDSENVLERAVQMREYRHKMIQMNDVETFRKAQPHLAGVANVFGAERAYEVGLELSRVAAIATDPKRGTPEAERIAQAQGNEAFAMALELYKGNKSLFFEHAELRLQGKSTGNPAADALADRGNLAELQVGSYNMKGIQQVYDNILKGPSVRNVDELLSDKTVNHLRASEDAQKALNNVMATEMAAIVGPQEMGDLLTEEGIRIEFKPIDPARVKDGNRWAPAEAFSIASVDDGIADRDARMMVRKLNALYSLLGVYKKPEELQKWAEDLSKYIDIDDPKFIDRNSGFHIQQLEARRKNIRNLYENRMKRTSPYSSREDIAEYKTEQEAEMNARLAAIDMQIKAERLRNPKDPLAKLPEGSEVDQEASAQRGVTVYKLPDGRLVSVKED